MAADGGPAIPRGVWVLGFVSMLMDVSSEMIHALLPPIARPRRRRRPREGLGYA